VVFVGGETAITAPVAIDDAAADLLGRERELRELSSGLDEATAGRGRLVLLVGEAGIGKTSLAEALARHAARLGVQVKWGRCWEGGGAPAYWPWLQVVSDLVRSATGRDPVAELGSGGEDLASLLAEPGAHASGESAFPSASPEEGRFHLYSAVGRFLTSVAASAPLVVILDDLHAGDGASLLLLRFVARQIRSAPILAMGTFRPLEARQRPETARLLGELTSDARTLPLTGLDRDAVGRLMTRTSGREPSHQLVSAVHEITEGNPLFVDELTRWLVAEGRFEAETIARGEIQLPAGVRQAIRARIRPLADETQAALSVAAAIGRAFDIPLLQRAAGLDLDVALRRIGEAVAAGVLTEVPGRLGTYAFAHPLIRESFYAEIAPHRRARMHGRIGQAIESLQAADLESRVSELAFHFCRASVAGERIKAVRYALRAGERALSVFAYEEAAAHFERGLRALELAADSAAERLGEGFLDLSRPEDAAEPGDAAPDEASRADMLARRLRALGLLARAAHAYGGFAIDEYTPEGVPANLLEEALANLDERDGALRARILACLSRLRVLSASWEVRQRSSREAIARARQAGDGTALAYALDAFMLVSWAEGPTGERIAAADEITRLAREIADDELEVHARLWRIGLLVDLGDLDAADRELAAHAERAARLEHPQLAWTVAVLEGMRAAVAGHFADVERHLGSALEIAQRTRIRPAARILAMQFLVLRRECGGLEETEGPLRAAVARHPPATVYRSVLALVCAELGRTAEARALLESLARNGFADLTRDSSWPVSVACLAEVSALLADRERAARLYDLIRPRDGTNLGVIVACLGPAAYYLGLLATTMERFEDAERHFESALRSSRQMEAEPFEARTEAAYARMLLVRGAPGDGARARDRSRHALDVARRLGMRRLVETLEASASPTPSQRTPSGPADDRRSQPEGAFIGRARELAQLEDAFGEARSGRGVLVLVSGEPGVGKTRLLGELAWRVAGDGARVLRAGSSEALGAPPYHQWTHVLRECLRQPPAGDPSVGDQREPARAGELQDLVPAGARPALLDSTESRLLLYEGVAAILRDHAAQRPVVIVLDDVQWADESSLLLLGFLARDLRDARVLLLAAYRDVEARLSAEIGVRIAELACEARTIHLGGLSEAEVAALVERSTGRPAGEIAGSIHRVTDGNPLFVEEVARALVLEGRLDAGLPAGAPLPERVRAVIGRRTRLVSEPCRRMLAIASVLGEDFDAAMLERVGAALGESTLDRVDEATGAGILIAEERRLSFAHDLFRETFYDALGARERERLHRTTGETLETLHAGEIDLWLPDLAHHYFLAGPSETEKAVRHSVRAAQRASRGFAHADAVGHYRKALRALSGSSESDAPTRCRIQLALGESLWSVGEFEEARQVYEQAADLAEALGLDEELARAALGFGSQDVSFDGGLVEPRLIRLLENGLARIGGDDGVLRASLLARLAAALAFSDDRSRGAALATEAVEIARRIGDKPTLHFALSCFVAATWGPDDLERRLAVSRETTRLAAEMGGVRGAELHGALMTALLESGDAAGAEREAEAYRQRTAVAGRRVSAWFLAVRRAMIALLEGRFAEVEALAAQALQLGSEGRNQNAAQYYGAQMLALRREQGRLEEMVAGVEQFMAAYPAVAAWRATLVWIHAEVGRDADARSELERIAAADFADLPRDMFWLLSLWLLAEAVAKLGDVRRARVLYELLLPYAGRCVTSGAAFCAGSVERSLGLLATSLSRFDDAARHFAAAIATNERIGARPWVAHAEHDYGRMLLARGAPGDREHARGRLARAASSARALGMRSLLDRTERLLAEPPPTSRPGGEEVEAVLRREGEYWTLVYAGSSARIRDARGLRLIALLVASPGRDFPAIDLAAWPAPPPPAGTVTRAVARAEGLEPLEGRGGGEAADARALAAYRERLALLREEVDEAERFNDPARAARAREEIDRLADEIASASRRGRRRRGSDAERARLSVTKAIRYALRKVERAHPPLARHLAAAVKTGVACRYEPGPGAPIRWVL
jgi:predicted ATPase